MCTWFLITDHPIVCLGDELFMLEKENVIISCYEC